MSFAWHDRDIDQLTILARDFERGAIRMHSTKPDALPVNGLSTSVNPGPRHPYVNFNSWEGKNASQWWAASIVATDTTTRDEAIDVARWLQESDDLTHRFECLPIIQKYRAAVKREAAQEAPMPA